MNMLSIRFNRFSALVLWSLVILLFIPVSVRASELLFILDCSGSMWGRVDNQPKINAAKSVLTELLDQVPEEMEIGLLVYGHRRKKDCGDIELVAGLGSPKENLFAALSRLNAKGKTPIESALIETTEVFKSQNSEKTAILISDGIETCGGDPCTTLDDLKKQGINITVHVVGFQVDTQAAAQLNCIAEKGDGRYFTADSTEDLAKALMDIKQNLVEQAPLPEPPAVEAIKATSVKSKRLKLKGPGTVTLSPAEWVSMPPKYWVLVDAETGEPAARTTGSSTKVKEGVYQIAWRQSEHKSTEAMLTVTVSVKSSENKMVPVDTGIRIILSDGIGNPKWWGLADVETDLPILKIFGTLAPQVTPAGHYKILWRQSEHGSDTINLGTYNIDAGRLNDIILDMGVNFQAADWVPSSFYYYGLADASSTIIGKWKNLRPQLVPPGEYTLLIRPTEHHNNEIVWSKITVPEHGFSRISIDSGVQFIHADGEKPPYRIFFTNLDSGEEITAKNTWNTQILPPGRYRLDWWESEHQSKRQTLVDEFEMEAGMLLELEL
ncbi:MAG: VWA domain-containing protein [Desulfobacteraceae bacterium]|nr:MAG: VWA domain-containing protein [Desulfobacteraceae bacterium]